MTCEPGLISKSRPYVPMINTQITSFIPYWFVTLFERSSFPPDIYSSTVKISNNFAKIAYRFCISSGVTYTDLFRRGIIFPFSLRPAVSVGKKPTGTSNLQEHVFGIVGSINNFLRTPHTNHNLHNYCKTRQTSINIPRYIDHGPLFLLQGAGVGGLLPAYPSFSRDSTTPVNRQTDKTKNITFPRTTHVVGNEIKNNSNRSGNHRP